MGGQPEEDLRQQLAASRVVPVIGAGVSRQVAGFPSWTEAIHSAFRHAVATGLADASQEAIVDRLLAAGDLVAAAQHVKQSLGAPRGEYGYWLKTTFATPASGVRPELMDAISDLLCPLHATTNYDRLLTDLLLGHPEPVSWRDPNAIATALQDGGRAIHLHGVYTDPESVIWGADNYVELASATGYEAVLRTLWINRTLLFIGCSFGGLRDPDFTRLLDWAAATFAGAPWKHFALISQDEVTPEVVRDFLLQWRVQVVPFGPTRDALAATLRALNPHRDRALARRVQELLRVLGSPPDDVRERILQLMRAIPAATAPVRPSLADVADTLLATERSSNDQMRGDLSTMQTLAWSIIDRDALDREIGRYADSQIDEFSGSFRTTVVEAAAALALFPEWLLSALKRRNVNIHGNYLSGYCRSVLEHVERGSSALAGDAYTLENLFRILSSLKNVLNADPALLFPPLRPGTLTPDVDAPSLAVLRSDRIELRAMTPAASVVAELPLPPLLRPHAMEIVRLDGAEALCVVDTERILAWSPRRAAAPVAIFKVGSAYGINGAAHQLTDNGLSTIVTTTDGVVYELLDLKQRRVFSPAAGSFLSYPVMAGPWLYAVVKADFPIVKLDLQQQSPREATWIDDAWMKAAVARLPGVPQVIESRLAADREYLGADDHESEAILGKRRFQHPELSRWRIAGRTVMALSVTLSFFTSTASLILLLDAEADKPTVLGHFFRDDATIAQFALDEGADERPRLLYALLSDFEEPEDLVGWARAAPTAQGWVFVHQGSSVRVTRDMIRVAFAPGETGFAADDVGGLLRLSMADESFEEVSRSATGSEIRQLRYYDRT